jgi:hypothetical protein
MTLELSQQGSLRGVKGCSERPTPEVPGTPLARRTALSIGALLAGTLSTPTLLAQTAGQAQIVGRLELGAPNVDLYLMHATLPLPRGTWTENGPIPLRVLNANGTQAPTQIETVSRYPNRYDGADVVELIARVRVPKDTAIGDRIRYDVALAPHTAGEFHLDKKVNDLVSAAGSVVLTTHDVFGNEYRADLLRDLRTTSSDLRVLRDGELVRQYATHEILLPVQPQAHGVYPHMMAVHAFVGEWSDERFLTIDLHVHNGLSGLDKNDPRDDAMQKLYFEQLDLHVPAGWQVFSDFASPTLGALEEGTEENVLPIITEGREGEMHVMPLQGHMVRRLVLALPGAYQDAKNMLGEKGLAFCVEGQAGGKPLWSWWNEKTANYYPQHHRLPSLSHVNMEVVRFNLAANFYHFENSIGQGIPPGYPVVQPALGYTQPWGMKYGGQTGGDEIVLYDGVDVAASASNEGYRMSQLAMRLYVDRQRSALYNGDGQPTRDVDWLVKPGGGGEPYIPMIYYGTPNLEESDPFGFKDAPTFHDDEVIAQGRLPWYEYELLGFQPIDLQHYIRYTRNLKTLAWLGNDALAKNELAMASENVRLSYHEYWNNPNGYVQGSGLRAELDYVENFPGWGFSFGRSNGWELDAALAAYALGNEERRERFYPWFQKIADLTEDGQSRCTGVLQATPSNKVADSHYRVVQSFEESITKNMLWGMRSTVFLGCDDAHAKVLEDVIAKSVYGECSPIVWRTEYGGPVDWVAVGPWDAALPPFCDEPLRADAQSYGSDHTMCWSDFAYGYELTRDPIFLERAKEVAGGEELYSYLMGSGLYNLNSRVAILALVQDLHQ